MEYKSPLRPATRELVAAFLEDRCPSESAMLAFGINTEWHYEALFLPFWEGEIFAEQLDEACGDGEKLTMLAFTARFNPHRFITFIID